MGDAGKKLVIHGGHGKAGSTAIQSFLYENCELLRQSKTLVVNLALTTDSVGSDGFGSTEEFYGYLLGKPEEFADRLLLIFDDENPAFDGFSTIIWSNESLITFYDVLAPRIELLARKWELTLVFILRNQVEWIASAYNQWVILDAPKNAAPISFSDHVEHELADETKNTKYHEILDGWSVLAPSVNIVSMPYPIETDVCRVFAGSLLSGIQGLAYSESFANETVSLSTLYLIKYLRDKLSGCNNSSSALLKQVLELVTDVKIPQVSEAPLSIFGQADYDFSPLIAHFEEENIALSKQHSLFIAGPRPAKLKHMVNNHELLDLCLQVICKLIEEKMHGAPG